MPKSQLAAVYRHLRRMVGLPAGDNLSDGQLLERFVAGHDEEAFGLLVARYGPMVLSVARRVLGNSHDADDAFQAAFLVLVRKAASLDPRGSLGSWLYSVAYRVALKARANAVRRRQRESQAQTMSADDSTAEVDRQEVHSVLDEELQCLPEKYRAPLVLCYFVGKTNEEAARELGCPPGSMWWRLDRARALLKTRLSRRGIGLSIGALTALLTESASAAVPTILIDSTLQTAALFAAGKAAVGSSAQAITLAEGALRNMLHQKIKKLAVATMVLLGVVGAGFGAWKYNLTAAEPAKQAAKIPLPPLVRSAQSGAWSAATTWEGGKLPAAGNRVQICTGHNVVYDRKAEDVIRSIHVAGTLRFAHDKDTRLDVGLIKIQPGDDPSEEGFDCEFHQASLEPGQPKPALEVGTADQPISAKNTALIRLTFVEGLNKESCPAIVCCGGRMDYHGAPLSKAWVKLGDTVKKGETTVTMAEAVTGWRVGDRVIVTATSSYEDDGKNKNPRTEERIIKAIDGTKLTLDEALENDHLGTGDYRGEVANLSRNVIVESADPNGERGHTMYHKNSAGSVTYAEFRHLGKANVLGRYALHFHLIGDTMRGSSVVGNSIWDSNNRWVTIHGTNYLVVRDNVGYKSVGHGYFFEDGTEVYNVLDHNLAVGAKRGKRLPKQILGFDANDGAGFWWANSLNTFTNNIATECGQYGFRFEATQSSAMKMTMFVQQPDGSKKEVDIRTLPFVRFDDNETHSNTGLYGVNLGEGVNRVGPDTKHPFIVRNLKIWNMHYGFRPQVPSLLVENLTLHRAHYGVYHPNYDNHVYRNVLISGSNTEPFNRGHDDDSIQYGPLTVEGLTFDNCRSGGMPLVQISDDNPTGLAVTHMRNVKAVNWADSSRDKAIVNLGGGPRPQPKSEKGVPVYIHDYYGPGQTAMVVSTRSAEFKADPTKFRAEKPLTGDESKVAEVKDVEFPKLLDPVYDLPPTTVITEITRSAGKVTVRGTTAGNNTVKRVLVNGTEAKAIAPNFAQWEVTIDLPGELKLQAHAEDAAGNVEKRAHEVIVVR